jgi:hypothetical protein
MDLVSYTGNGTSQSIAHNLGYEPELIIIKNIDIDGNWVVYSKYATDTSGNNVNELYANFNLDDEFKYGPAAWNSTSPTSTHFTVGSSLVVNRSGDEIHAYLFRSVPGFLKHGYYIGNGSTDGPRLHFGFKPRFMMYKKVDVSGGAWAIVDSTRDPYNTIGKNLAANTNNAENTFDLWDFLSNGAKCRYDSNAINVDGVRYIYLAIADMPFPFCNAF